MNCYNICGWSKIQPIFFYKFFLTFILHCDTIIIVNHIGNKRKVYYMYAEKLNIYYGVCSRQVTVMVAVPGAIAFTLPAFTLIASFAAEPV